MKYQIIYIGFYQMSSTTSDKKRGCPRKSIWEYYTEIIQDTGTTKKRPGAKCNFCKQQWTRGKSLDMIAHLALTCLAPPPPEIRSKFCEILHYGDDSNDEVEDTIKPLKKRQTKMSEHVEKSTITENKQRRCIHALTKFFVCCGIPFWIIENPFFINFIKSLCPDFELPGRTTLSTTLINSECGIVLSEIKKELANETNLTLGKYLCC